ncbi:hypothetical protein CALCODRAFT_72677 [Calocera cornea HHB12733]|uniref:Secreted protein n=1 Tax=Calocera cornea HHB12733 TaxID=1353952 RepID=A0A165ITE4_9BASI|nr:hypothetical protein CALCODRAFT_72677 [Calocera cornea HHB12733]
MTTCACGRWLLLLLLLLLPLRWPLCIAGLHTKMMDVPRSHTSCKVINCPAGDGWSSAKFSCGPNAREQSPPGARLRPKEHMIEGERKGSLECRNWNVSRLRGASCPSCRTPAGGCGVGHQKPAMRVGWEKLRCAAVVSMSKG